MSDNGLQEHYQQPKSDVGAHREHGGRSPKIAKSAVANALDTERDKPEPKCKPDSRRLIEGTDRTEQEREDRRDRRQEYPDFSPSDRSQIDVHEPLALRDALGETVRVQVREPEDEGRGRDKHGKGPGMRLARVADGDRRHDDDRSVHGTRNPTAYTEDRIRDDASKTRLFGFAHASA